MFWVVDQERKIARSLKYKSPTGKGKEPIFLPKFTKKIIKEMEKRWG